MNPLSLCPAPLSQASDQPKRWVGQEICPTSAKPQVRALVPLSPRREAGDGTAGVLGMPYHRGGEVVA